MSEDLDLEEAIVPIVAEEVNAPNAEEVPAEEANAEEVVPLVVEANPASETGSEPTCQNDRLHADSF